MTQKKKKSKTSSIKRSNQLRTRLTKQGKLKKRHHKKKVTKKPSAQQPVVHQPEQPDLSDHDDDIHDMVEEDDLAFLKKAVAKKSYTILKDIDVEGDSKQRERKRKLKSNDNEDDVEKFENEYEQSIAEPNIKRKRYLLPIKTAEGLVPRVEDIEDSEVEDENIIEQGSKKTDEKNDSWILGEKKEVSTAELLAKREKSLQKQKFRIGILCSGLLENPEAKVKNFKPLLDMMNEKDPEIQITVKKLSLVSLLEVFKDLLPAYQIKHHDDPKVKLKKDVKALHDFENGLLKAYKTYLQIIEKMMAVLKRKKGDTRVFKEPELKLAELALQSLCQLLTTHSYFNFAKNIIQLIVPFLNNVKDSVRGMVSTAVKEIFKTDKRGTASLEIVRCINKFIRSRKYNVHPDVLKVFLYLKLKGVDLDQEKESEMNKKKLRSKKGNILRLSKRERKRNKRLEQVEKEMLETKAEENTKAKQQQLTDITKLVFMIYFKVLKEAPSSKLLNASLEGLAKFAHCINIDFYHDLIKVLDDLIEKETLGYKEQLCCVQTVFTILSHQGTSINIDPLRFYSYLYCNLLSVHAGRNHCDLPIILRAADAVLLKRRKHLSLQRLLAFTKRLCALSLQVLPNGALGLMGVMRHVLQNNKTAEVLLDVDTQNAQGVYLAELEEPEYCNASATALWELLALKRHYHPSVQEYGNFLSKIDKQTETAPKAFMKMSPEALYKEFDFSEVKFNPPVPAPKKFPKKKRHDQPRIVNTELDCYIKTTLSNNKITL